VDKSDFPFRVIMNFMEQDQINNAAEFGSLRNDSARFRTVPNDSEEFRNIPKASERSERHTLTVRDVARMFEAAGVARTERSIVNWCQLNSQEVARLDAYFDPNERRYYITPQSVEVAIAEEKAKAARNTPLAPAGSVPQDAESLAGQQGAHSGAASERAKKLEKEAMDLKILNSGKDFLIEQLRQERNSFFDQLLDASRKVGELETKLLQLSSPGEGCNRPEKASISSAKAP